MELKYDSRIDTQDHIHVVARNLMMLVAKLILRASLHDRSKLASPEVEVFDEMTPRLKALVYGSDEYKEGLAQMKPALDHHYANNSHHPEHYPNGIRGMCLLDIVEMICDWHAAGQRHADGGSLVRSINLNQKRFGYSDELKDIFLNTVKYFDEFSPKKDTEHGNDQSGEATAGTPAAATDGRTVAGTAGAEPQV